MVETVNRRTTRTGVIMRAVLSYFRGFCQISPTSRKLQPLRASLTGCGTGDGSVGPMHAVHAHRAAVTSAIIVILPIITSLLARTVVFGARSIRRGLRRAHTTHSRRFLVADAHRATRSSSPWLRSVVVRQPE